MWLKFSAIAFVGFVFGYIVKSWGSWRGRTRRKRMEYHVKEAKRHLKEWKRLGERR